MKSVKQFLARVRRCELKQNGFGQDSLRLTVQIPTDDESDGWYRLRVLYVGKDSKVLSSNIKRGDLVMFEGIPSMRNTPAALMSPMRNSRWKEKLCSIATERLKVFRSA